MARKGWQSLCEGYAWYRKPGRFPMQAYSEFMPPPRVGGRPYAGDPIVFFDPADPHGWPVSEYEQAVELDPGLLQVAKQFLHAMRCLAQREHCHGISRAKLVNNPYWPEELSSRAGKLSHERFVILAPLALSRTQDDKGRVRWTLFGSSEQGPERPFWQGFYHDFGREWPLEQSLDFVRRLLHTAYGETLEALADLRGAGFRILPTADEPILPHWHPGALPAWTKPFILGEGASIAGVRYLLTFRAFGRLPKAVRKAYLDGQLHLLPFPGSLFCWGAEPVLKLQHEMPLAWQLPLLQLCQRHEAPRGLRVPQSGWMHEPHAAAPEPDPSHGPLRNTYVRTHRWARIHRHEDELAIGKSEDRVAHVLFSTSADDIGLYDKPMARNVQLWSHDYRLLLDGPRAKRSDLCRTAGLLAAGGHFGYRFFFPPMQVGRHQVFWHRPLVACLSARSGEVEVVRDAPLGYLTAYPAGRVDVARPVEFWPRPLRRATYLAAIDGFDYAHGHRRRQNACNVRKLLDAWHLWDERPLPRSFADALLTLAPHETLDSWLESIPANMARRKQGRRLAEEVRGRLAAEVPAVVRKRPHPSLTYARTARRPFEVAYWRTIARLATGQFRNKDNGDCVLDDLTRSLLAHHHRDLDALGDHLLQYYRGEIARHEMTGKALAGELPFSWTTDFEYHWLGGWKGNQDGSLRERDIVTVIPGRDRSRAVIFGDHYDTAYMEDIYEKDKGGSGARLAAAGADDNHSATATLMLAAPIFLEMSRQGRLACDVWLVHLTGEEFPADCMGARQLVRRLVEGNMELVVPKRRPVDLSRTSVQGLYVLDMIAHNNDHRPDVFQIAPGAGRQSLWLAYQAHMATRIWNENAPLWNERSGRSGRGRRGADPDQVPAVVCHPRLRGEVRPASDPRSTLFNTDGQVFSDGGVPSVLFMENYDINRTGYHDTHDNMSNIDLDYGSAVAAIAIEAVARAVNEEPGSLG